MRFQIPQFIDVEEKIFGPLSFKQFIYLLGGVGLSFVIYKSLPFIVAVLLIIPILLLSACLAFYKFNNRPFIFTLESFFYYLVSKKMYIWKKIERKREISPVLEKKDAIMLVPSLSSDKIKDIAWQLDVQDESNKKEDYL